ncbi:hypothetical protein FG386_002213 [Cryptosporidium ryanae]|uniref:uncharacterized protein n=1 Tax=Cryptosporidium ryanae TaxID=515981 RepID=UPI00351A2E9A|nr:hypothetical protein FG386_002213 [Cryptosporidium ryanae]
MKDWKEKSSNSWIIDSFSEQFRDEYCEVSDPQIAVNGDVVYDSNSYSGQSLENDSFHVPHEQKLLQVFKKSAYSLDGILKSPGYDVLNPKGPKELGNNEIFFPRIKHFRRKLPVLPPEPYQRLMTFAIEVCMMPKLWYLELIHCMFMGMAPFFKGMLMSYSLQDVVGSALMTVGYLDSNFSMENCYRAVSMVSDNNISPNYEYICDKMKACLESGVFENGEYARLKDEFLDRIKGAYTSVKINKEDMEEVASYYLRLATSSSPYSKGYEKNHNTRTFLPVRAMASMISIINIGQRDIVEKFKSLYYLISYGTMISVERYFKYCYKFLARIISLNYRSNNYLFECLCKDFMSVGFIDEGFNVIGSDREKFIQATRPSRVLSKGYGSVVPSMLVDEEIENIDTEWLNFTPDEDEITEAPLPRPATHRFYTSKLFSKTKKRGERDLKHVRNTRLVSKRICKKKSLSSRVVRTVNKVVLPKYLSNGFLINDEDKYSGWT